FCPERVETVTPKLPAPIAAEGRIRSGEALLFPNLLPYSKHSSVSVYSPERHFLPLEELTPRLLADNLAVQVAFARAVCRLYPELGFQSFNLALYGAPAGTDGYPLNLRLISRSNLAPLYRSDATWLERLHWEAAIDVVPEDLAARARVHFAS